MLRFILHITALTSVLFPFREMTVYQHFCHDKLITSELFERTTDSCCETTEESCDGCKNEEITLSIDDFQSVQAPNIVPSSSLVTIIAHNTQLDTNDIQRDGLFQSSANDPPVISSGKHRSILLQTFSFRPLAEISK